ncbi:MAG: WGR domain-containing protein [Undibacterium sp.]
MQVTKITLDHKGGTKSYNLIVVDSNDSSRSILIKRWGKTGALGQMSSHFGSSLDMNQVASDTVDEKTRRGYGIARSDQFQADDSADLARHVGRTVWPKIGADAINYLDPGIDTTGWREPDAPTMPEDSKMGDKSVPREARKFVPSAEDEARAQAEQELKLAQEMTEMNKLYSDNPEFARF